MSGRLAVGYTAATLGALLALDHPRGDQPCPPSPSARHHRDHTAGITRSAR